MKQKYTPLPKETLLSIKVGDVVERMLAFAIPQYLVVQSMDDKTFDAGLWTFDRNTGVEIDEDIPSTVSYIRRVLTEEQKQLLDSGADVVPYT